MTDFNKLQEKRLLSSFQHALTGPPDQYHHAFWPWRSLKAANNRRTVAN